MRDAASEEVLARSKEARMVAIRRRHHIRPHIRNLLLDAILTQAKPAPDNKS